MQNALFCFPDEENEKLRFSNPENYKNKILTTFKVYKLKKLMILFKRSHIILDEADESPKPIKNSDTKLLRLGVPPLMEGYGRENDEKCLLK